MAIHETLAAGVELSPQQRRGWLGAAGEPGWAEAVFLLEGELRPELLRRSAERAVERHEILRTTFRRDAWSTIPSQVVEDRLAPCWEEVDLSGSGAVPGELGGEAETAALEHLLAAPPPLDLERGPVLGLTLARLGARRHLLALRLSALASDARSLSNLMAELAEGYGAAASPAHGDGAEEALQYADFAAWQNELLAPDDPGAELVRAFWARSAAPAGAEAALPGATRPAAGQAMAPLRFALPLAAERLSRLEEMAERQGVELPTLLLAAWHGLLFHLTGRAEVCVGRLLDGRKLPELEAGLGPFARWLPVGVRCRPDRPFGELLAAVADAEREAGEWQEYGVAEAEAADGAPEPFDLLFESEPWPAPIERHGLRLSLRQRRLPVPRGAARLVCERREGGFAAELWVDARRLSPGAGRRLAARLLGWLERLAEVPDRALGDLDAATEGERHAALVELNDSGPPVPGADTVHELIGRRALATPQAPAVVCGEECLTYAELEARANRLAHHLRDLGVGPEVRVAVFGERSPAFVVALLAVLKAGGAYLPLDPAFPRERLAPMLEDARPAVVVTEQALAAALPATGLPVVCWDADRAAIEARPAHPPAGTARGENLAYVLFTSGSTGRPKGVAVEHRQLLSYVGAILERLDPPAGARFATVSTFAADLGNTMVFPALATGGCLHVLTQATATTPEALGDYNRRHEIDYLKIVPSHLEALLAGVEPARVLPRRGLVLGGEASRWDLVRRLTAGGGGPLVMNHYGPTETTVGVLAGRLVAPAGEGAPVPLGRPLAGSRVYLVDARLRPVVPGVAGELVIGGAGVARGYLGRPAATAERFVPSPFPGPAGERLYRTGDRVRLYPGGGLEFLGRVDHQVKVHGFRIELGEIEAAIAAHPRVREVAVVLREDRPGERRLVAYLVPRGAAPAAGDLRAALRERLPEYMLPSAFVDLPALPLTPNGKLDRGALPAPERSRGGERDYVAGRTPVEETLAAIWAQVLGVEKVGIHDNFFELGGDSILVIQVVAKANRAGLRIAPRQLFQQQTIADLAAVATSGEAATAVAAPETGPVPLTPIQQWFFERQLAQPGHWNQALLLETATALDPGALAAALDRLVDHHDALRLRYRRTADGWLQTCVEPWQAPAAVCAVDLSALPAAALPPAVEAVAALAQRSLDLEQGPLARAVVFACGAGRPGRLLLVLHHLGVDAVSWRILLEDLASLYAAPPDAVPLAPRTTPFGTWARRLAAHARSPDAAAELDLWLAAAPPELAPLPVDDPAGDDRVASAASLTRALPAEATAGLLQEATAAFRAEPADVLATAVALAVSAWSGERRVGLELEGHGREPIFEDLDLSRTVGWFTTHYPVFFDLAADGDAGEALRAVKERLRGVPRHGLGFGLLALAGDPEVRARLAALPRPEVGFNYLGRLDRVLDEGSPFRPAGESAGPSIGPANRRERPIGITARVVGGCLEVTWSFSRARHRRQTIERLAASFEEAVAAILAASRAAEKGSFTPSDFPLAGLSQSQLEKIARKVGQAKGGSGDAV